MHNLLDKIQSLKNFFTGNKGDETDITQIDGWYEEAKKLLLLDNLAEHDGVKYVIETFKGEIEQINSALLNQSSKELCDNERDRMLDKRALAQKYLDLFIHNKEELAQIENLVDNNVIK